MGGVIFQMYYGLIESQLFIILTKYISLERSESESESESGSESFCDKSNSGREIDTFVTEKCIKKIKRGLNGTRWLFVV